MKKHSLMAGLLFLSGIALQTDIYGQVQKESFKSVKNFSGYISSTNQYYFANRDAGILLPSKRFASNTYFNFNYNYNHFVAGLQAEAYLPALQGFKFTPGNKNKIGLTHYFAGYKSKTFDITAGTFYDQFGNGLIFRSYEDRQLGIDNAMRGVHVRVKPFKFLEVKAFYGKQRYYFDYSPGAVAGADVSLQLFNTQKNNRITSLSIGGSFLNIHQDSVTSVYLLHHTNTPAWAVRTNFISGNYQLDVEYMQHTPVAYYPSGFFQNGSALLINQNYITKGGLGFNLIFRRLELASLKANYNINDINNYVNYLPSLTKLHTWLVSSIYPAIANPDHEIGGQLSISYLLKRNTAAGGRYGTKLFINASLYKELSFSYYSQRTTTFNAKFFDFGGTRQYSDINLSVEKRLTKNIKATAAFIKQYSVENGSVEVKTETVATDFLFTLNDNNSLRTELQHMWNNADALNWAAAVVEYTHKEFSFFATDLNDYQSAKIHYYTAGSSYSRSAHRFMISFGKQRAGLLCAGGICRYVPAYMGFTASYNYNF